MYTGAAFFNFLILKIIAEGRKVFSYSCDTVTCVIRLLNIETNSIILD